MVKPGDMSELKSSLGAPRRWQSLCPTVAPFAYCSMPCSHHHVCLLRSTTGAMGTAEGPGRHVCDVLELPRPGRGFDCTPTAADPLLISYLIGNDKVDKYHRWGGAEGGCRLVLLAGTCPAACSLG
jgi:hypothetical protein